MINLNLSKIPEPANLVLRYFIIRVDKALPGRIMGVYVTGSIAVEDFHPSKSDLDMVVLLDKLPEPDSDTFRKLQQIHTDTVQRFGRPYLNGYYVDFIALQKMGNEAAPLIPCFYKNKISFDKPALLGKVDLLEFSKNAIAVFGFSFSIIVTTPSVAKVNAQLHENINSYWAQWIQQHSGILGRLKLLLFPWLTEWGILGVARQLYTLHTGEIASKLKAGRYVRLILPEKYSDIISHAIIIRQKNNSPYSVFPSLYRAKMVLPCMKAIITQFNRDYKNLEKLNY
jgi:predicted nucleotidyltransferase